MRARGQKTDRGSDGRKAGRAWVWRSACAAWCFGFASFGLAWLQARSYVFHPHFLPLTLLFVGLAFATFAALAAGGWRVCRGPFRLRALLVMTAASLPAGIWAGVGYVANRNFADRWMPNTLTMRLAKVMGATFMDLDARLSYRRRTETERLVMVYHPRRSRYPERVDRPGEDLAAMERYLADLERKLGEEIAEKIYWVRGPSLGVEYVSYHGLALGSSSSPHRPEGGYRGDRHELAHAALDSFRTGESDPPYILHEGWAMANCGDDVFELAHRATVSRRENPSAGIRELLGPDWYYRGAGPVYDVGGAFVGFLVRTRGGSNFRRFYTRCQPGAVDSLCQEIYGIDLDDLEEEFWDDVKRTLTKGEPRE